MRTVFAAEIEFVQEFDLVQLIVVVCIANAVEAVLVRFLISVYDDIQNVADPEQAVRLAELDGNPLDL